MDPLQTALMELGPIGALLGVGLMLFQKSQGAAIAERKEREAEHRTEREVLRAIIQQQHTEGQALQKETNIILASLTESIKDSIRSRRIEQ